MARLPVATRFKWVRFPPAFLEKNLKYAHIARLYQQAKWAEIRQLQAEAECLKSSLRTGAEIHLANLLEERRGLKAKFQ